MKRLLIVLILFVLLAGCTVYDPQPSLPSDPAVTTAPEQTDATAPTKPGLYQPQSAVEQQTNGAVRAYPTGKSVSRGVTRWNDQILMFSVEDASDPVVTLTLLTGEDLHETYSVKLDCAITPMDTGFAMTENKLGFYSGASGSVVILDSKLRETSRVTLPEGIQGNLALSSDLKTVYYCTGSQIRAWNLETGISRLLKEQPGVQQTIRTLCFNDTMLVCDMVEADGDRYVAFISTESGQTVGTDDALLDFSGNGEQYMLKRREGSVHEYLFGSNGRQVNAFYPAQPQSRYVWLPEISSVLTQYETDSGALSLELYDLESGKRTASMNLQDIGYAHSVFSDGTYIWLTTYDAQQHEEIIYRWDPRKTAISGTTVYTSPRYTADSPDEAGLSQCRQWADSLENTYGVKLHFDGSELPANGAYTVTGEYHTVAIRNALAQAEAMLGAFPEGFFPRLGSVTADGAVHIGIVRQISDQTEALQYWHEGNAYILLTIGNGMAQSFYHELYYVVDTFLLSNSSILDHWNNLNPRRFHYDLNYTDYLSRVDQTYLTGSDRAFIDPYSMTFPKEDRARIFEYAMLPGCESYFEAGTMEDKLDMLCNAIRDAFDWKKSDTVFLWEQYL